MNSASPHPTRHDALQQTLKTQIRDGALESGERLPSIIALCHQYGVSNTTVRSVLRDLARDGWIESRPGSGYYVRGDAGQSPSAPGLTGSNTLALVVAASGNVFYGEIIRGAEAVCRDRGYRLVVAYSNEDMDMEARQISELAYQVAGLMILPVSSTPQYAAYATLFQRDIPFVFVDCRVDKLDAPLVSTDNEQGGFLAATHLFQSGKRELYVVSERLVSSLEDRVTGFRRGMRELGLVWDASRLRKCMLRNDEAGYVLTHALLSDLRRKNAGSATLAEPIGLFAVNVAVAHGCYVAIREAGLRIPQDVALVGFDDDYAPFLDPPLTTIRQDPRRMGELSAETLFQMLRATGGRIRRRNALLAPELIVRGSSDPCSTFSPDAELRHRVRIRTQQSCSLLEEEVAATLPLNPK